MTNTTPAKVKLSVETGRLAADLAQRIGEFCEARPALGADDVTALSMVATMLRSISTSRVRMHAAQ